MAISTLFPEVWAKKMELTFKKDNQASVFADMQFESSLKKWDTLHRQYGNIDPNDAPGVHTRGTDMSYTSYDATDETMIIDQEYSTLYYVEDLDETQSEVSIAAYYGEQFGHQMKVQIDSSVFGEVVNAYSTVDAGDVGWTAEQGITLSTSNVLNVLTAIRKKLKKLNVDVSNIKGAIPPEFTEILTLYIAWKDTRLGDEATQRGYFGSVNGIDLYESNNLTGTAVLSLATQPTAGDTVTIWGQTFTFVASPSAAGDIDIGASVDATRANLATLINAPATTTAGGVALTGQELKNFQARVSAVNDDTANTLTVTYKGIGAISVSETLTDGTDTWTTAKIKEHCLFVADKWPALVVQQTPKTNVVRNPVRAGVNVQMICLYGTKTYSDQAKKMVNVEIASSTF